MKFYHFYFYYYFAFPLVSISSRLVTSITMNLPKINILVCLLPQPFIFLLLVFQSEAQTLLNCVPAKLKEPSVCIC
jgi:hypothetical protein